MSTAERTQTIREHYAIVLEEIILNAESLSNSYPLSRMSSEMMQMQKDEALCQIDHVVDFLTCLRGKVEDIKTVTITE